MHAAGQCMNTAQSISLYLRFMNHAYPHAQSGYFNCRVPKLGKTACGRFLAAVQHSRCIGLADISTVNPWEPVTTTLVLYRTLVAHAPAYIQRTFQRRHVTVAHFVLSKTLCTEAEPGNVRSL